MNDSLKNELDAMSKAVEEPENTISTDPPSTDPPATDAPSTESSATEAPSTDAPSTEAPKTEAPSTDAPEEDPKDKEIRELREKLAEKLTPKSTKAPSTESPSTEAPISDEDFIGETDLDELTRDPKLFNKVLNDLYKKALVVAKAEVRSGNELVVRSIPDIVKNNIALGVTLKKVNEDFYNENKDLIPWKKAVGTVFEEFIAESPDKSYKELLPEVAIEVRKRLNLKKETVKKKDDNNNDDDPPTLPRKKGSKRTPTKPNPDPLLKEMDAMDKALGLD